MACKVASGRVESRAHSEDESAAASAKRLDLVA